MHYTVTWTDQAHSALAARWLNTPAPQRPHLTRCIDEIDAELRENAHQKGILLVDYDPLRTFFARPQRGKDSIGVFFVVSEPDRMVQILGLRVLAPRLENDAT
jgi:hypothetical protein